MTWSRGNTRCCQVVGSHSLTCLVLKEKLKLVNNWATDVSKRCLKRHYSDSSLTQPHFFLSSAEHRSCHFECCNCFYPYNENPWGPNFSCIDKTNHFSKYLLLSSRKRNSHSFGKTWVWVNENQTYSWLNYFFQ